jgi:hypothetical protein
LTLGIFLLALESGDFNDQQTWCGELIPVPSMCALNGGCDLSIPSSTSLSITDIDSQLSLPITTWIINGTLNLGSPDLQTGFYFGTSCNVTVNSGGALIDLTTGNQSGIYFPQNSQLIIQPNGTLKGQNPFFIYSYQLGDITHITGKISFSLAELYNTTEQFKFTFDENSSPITFYENSSPINFHVNSSSSSSSSCYMNSSSSSSFYVNSSSSSSFYVNSSSSFSFCMNSSSSSSSSSYESIYYCVLEFS